MDKQYILGIDLSRAFDTVDRSKLMSVLTPILTNDELRLTRNLLSTTSLSLRPSAQPKQSFPTNIGVPQGDALSPVLFIVYLEATLRDVSASPHLPPNLLSRTIAYADDADFICTNPTEMELIIQHAPPILRTWSLEMNIEKTEYSTLQRQPLTPTDTTDVTSWRNCKKLGSLLDDSNDLKRRFTLARSAFHRMWRLWFRRDLIAETTRLRLYNCYVLPVLTYNCGTWALTQSQLLTLESFHRRQLRALLGIFYPNHISNEALFTRCNCEPLRYTLIRARWTLFGHILRRPPDIPANVHMLNYFTAIHIPKWRGGPHITLPVILDRDLSPLQHFLRVRTAEDITNVRRYANDKERWRTLTNLIFEHCPPPPHRRQDNEHVPRMRTRPRLV
ncbi:hypothetical protein Ae201684P_016449 [Aphanomyces euteiches]|uniref:Reverse transcriptase domain-containing protein n=1 Tax=Aphanomyces euteiches TaxID=100861 RepID=A0A6G0WMT2_9STRA|nr:hypothetical protein Ae201684_013597 [Aphanomyces euteiches]KAH9093827.1 hypothetical protein Ae201684P_016449 [Aphanomyces euteiches]